MMGDLGTWTNFGPWSKCPECKPYGQTGEVIIKRTRKCQVDGICKDNCPNAMGSEEIKVCSTNETFDILPCKRKGDKAFILTLCTIYMLVKNKTSRIVGFFFVLYKISEVPIFISNKITA